LVFLFVLGSGYYFLRETIISNNTKDKKILFYKIQSQTDSLLSKLLNNYTLQKETILQKHKIVKEYIQSQPLNPLNVSLEEIWHYINQDNNETLYNIEVSDKNYIVRNTTYKPDLDFDLSFAKKDFDKHFDENITGVCIPLFEKVLKQFISYADAYLLDANNQKNGILLVSYRYPNLTKKLQVIQKNIKQYANIVNAKAYILVDGEFLNYIELQEHPPHKANINEVMKYIQDAQSVKKRLADDTLTIESYTLEHNFYTAMYLAVESSIDSNIDIIYEIVLDDTQLHKQLYRLNLLMLLLGLIGVITIILTTRLRKKEIKLSQQDTFIQSSMHEIKTPLSIITLNNELRELEFGGDEYSSEIESAIKTLKTSYEDMSFTITKDEMDYPLEILSLETLVKERVSYFQSIANSNDKSFKLLIHGSCDVNISYVELVRLIDNNLSNAIKYSKPKSTITVSLHKNTLSIHSFGNPIQDTTKIFNKYFRENKVIGGHGLGLSIVKEIAKKYKIHYTLISDEKNGTTFSYIFQCHSNDI